MQIRQTGVITASNGTSSLNTLDGPYSAVNFADRPTLCNALTKGPVKIGVAAGQLQNVVNGSNGWFLTNARPDSNEDHCTGLCGYGPISWLAQQLAVPVPEGIDGTKFGYLFFTWSTIGIIDEPSLYNITGEAWLRNPTNITTVGPTPSPTPAPTPQPTPAPTPTRRATSAAATLAAMFAEGDEGDKAEVLSVIEKAEAVATKLKAKHDKKIVK
jgi:hypothetical protein